MRKLIVALVCVSACAPRVPPPLPGGAAPAFADFVRPDIPPSFAGTSAALGQDRGWRFLQVGDLRTASREFSAALKATPGFYPAETSLGYVELARKDANAALPHFDRALRWSAADRAALVGRGEALLAMGRERDALGTFEVALAADRSLTELARRVEILRFRIQERTLSRARQAFRDGRWDEAAREYAQAITDSPDSAFLYRELADVERKRGNTEKALQEYGRAAALDHHDTASLMAIGEILEDRGDFDRAATMYREANAVEPSPALAARLEAVRARQDAARLPAEYRAIGQASTITRADLAALVGVRLAPLLAVSSPRPALVTDLRTSWASSWILSVTRAGVMEPFANHAFQPKTVVRRIDLAQVVSRLLVQIAARGSSAARTWESARVRFSDLAPAHLAYLAASQAVASGVMRTESSNAFLPFRPVTGPEATEAVARLEALAGIAKVAR